MTPYPGATVWGYAPSDEELRWKGAYPTREQAIAAGCAALDRDQDVWVVRGEVLDPGEAMMSAYAVIDWMPETASDAEWSEVAVEELAAIRRGLPAVAALELDALLNRWARKWFKIEAWRMADKPEKVRDAR